MAAQILSFRSLPRANDPKTPSFGPGALPPSFRPSPSHSKVLIMSKYTRRRLMQDSFSNAQAVLTKVEMEMAHSYFEVEITGITLTRLICVYTVALRNAKARVLDGIRSLLHTNPAHEVTRPLGR